MNKCNHCGEEIKPNCDWRQGRCPHRQSMLDSLLSDTYKARYYNLLTAFRRLFK